MSRAASGRWASRRARGEGARRDRVGGGDEFDSRSLEAVGCVQGLPAARGTIFQAGRDPEGVCECRERTMSHGVLLHALTTGDAAARCSTWAFRFGDSPQHLRCPDRRGARGAVPPASVRLHRLTDARNPGRGSATAGRDDRRDEPLLQGPAHPARRGPSRVRKRGYPTRSTAATHRTSSWPSATTG